MVSKVLDKKKSVKKVHVDFEKEILQNEIENDRLSQQTVTEEYDWKSP